MRAHVVYYRAEVIYWARAIPSAIEMEVVDILVAHNVAKKRIVFLNQVEKRG